MPQILIYSLITGTQVLVLALALYLVYAVSKVQNLALGGIAASVAYALYFVLHGAALPYLWSGLLFALAIAVGLGMLNFFLNESFTKKQEYLLALLVSFSLGIILESVISILFGTDGKSLVDGVLPAYAIGAYQIPLSGVLILAFGVVCALASFFLARYTAWGRALRAIAEHPFSASSLGVDQRRIRMFVYVFASVIAGGIGILSGLNTALTPMMGFNLIIMAFIALLVGGVTDIRGTIIASYLVALIPELIIGLSPGVSSNWKMVLVFGIALLLLVVRPEGIMAQHQRKS